MAIWKRIQHYTNLSGCYIHVVYKVQSSQTSQNLQHLFKRTFSVRPSCDVKTVDVLGSTYTTDQTTNVTQKILEKIGKNLHCKHNHPLNLITRRIENYFNNNFRNNWRAPMFSKFDRLSPVVTLTQNFDTLLVPPDHPSRALSESYYLNSTYMLRAHTSAHQSDLIKTGLDAFLVVGDVYRRDTVDASHYPAFHQMEGVRLFSKQELFSHVEDTSKVTFFEEGTRNGTKQERLTVETSLCLEQDLKDTLRNLANHLFGDDVEMQWVDAYFPFTHPSWELEIKYQGEWLEVLGCGLIEQDILTSAGADSKVGWAFGLGLERLAMRLYSIPDIRLFWSEDSRFYKQFDVDDPDKKITFKPFSKQSPCINDVSFWVPNDFSENDFYDIVRSIGSDLVESVELFDDFVHPKTKRRSKAYHITYRHMERSLTQEEVNDIHGNIMEEAVTQLGIQIR
ncbi:phenylalanine--tRNA ligase, mitochondrial-like [Saccostrea echinata]|uniref:phenylalanine--tRNA ligase, mitochondrial-like n=1 Tax=Saccostrea echinata TaxID=191078 RepID=UPI002A819B27|nr:phenylalanine--tRNA ligase, mitochondrial-like [Saccostrea echinata]